MHATSLVTVKKCLGDEARIDGGTVEEPIVQPGYIYLVNEMLVLSMYNVCRPRWLCLGTPGDGQTRRVRVLRSKYTTVPSSLGKDAVIDFGIIPVPLSDEERKKYAVAMYIWRFLAELGTRTAGAAGAAGPASSRPSAARSHARGPRPPR